jgi:hypothetical protein
MAKLPLSYMQDKGEPSPGTAEEAQVAEMDPEAQEMEMTYEQQRLATIRYALPPFRPTYLISR